MNYNYEIIILYQNDISNKKHKNQSFIVLPNDKTLLEHQLSVVDEYFENSRITLITHDRKEFDDFVYSGPNYFRVLRNNNIVEQNSANNLEIALRSCKWSNVIVFPNNIFFTVQIFQDVPTKSSIYINDEKQGNLSVIENEDKITNMFWNIGKEWSKILLLRTKNDLINMKKLVSECHSNQFLFEAINHAIIYGVSFKPFKHPGVSININRKNDIKKIQRFIKS